MTDKESNKTDLPSKCVFCGKNIDSVDAMFSGINAEGICSECVLSFALTLESKLGYNLDSVGFSDADLDPFLGLDEKEFSSRGKQKTKKLSVSEILENLPTPTQLYDQLAAHVVGQKQAKRALSVAVYNHYKRIGIECDSKSDVEIAKSNILLLGPTGVGKTLLAQTLARLLKVPFAIADATTLTEAGYVGEDVENILLKLITAADFDIEHAEIGIIYIDEIDKIARKAENLSITRDVSGEGVQQALLKIVEGTQASVPPQGGRKHPQQELIHIDTTNILFILGGAFVGLSDIIAQRVGKNGLGFNAELPAEKIQAETELLQQVLPEDLTKFGMIPEFVGRIPVITSLSELTEKDLIAILTQPKNALIKQYVKMFEFENAKLIFDDDAVAAIAHEAYEQGVGARGLRTICERVLMDTMFELPDVGGKKSITIHKSDVEGSTSVQICREA